MKSKLIQPLSFFVCVLFTCCYNEKDVPFEHRELFTLTVPSDFNSDEGDHWIILSNALGDAITWQSFNSGEQVKLSGDVKQGTTVVTVTLLSYNIYYDNYSVESFADIPIGSEWTLPVDTYGTFPVAGHISFRLSGFPASDPSYFVLSSLNGTLGPGFIYGNPGSNFSIPKSPCQVFLHMPYNAGSVPKYMVIDHVTAGDIIDVSFNKLSDYDHIFAAPITLDIGNYMASVRGFHTPIEAHNDSNSHTLTYFDGGRNFDPSQFTVTYNDGYSFYKTGWEAATPFNVTRYEKIGAPPTPDNFVIPNYKMRTDGRQVNDFHIVSETQFAFNAAMWKASGSKLTWWVNRPEAAQHPILTKFPDELTSRHKLLTAYANDLKLWQFILYDVRSGFTYENWLGQTYDPTAFQYREREYYSLEVHMY